LVDAIAPLNDAQLGLTAAPGLWPVRMLVSHVVSVRHWYFSSWMGEGGTEWMKYDDWDEREEMATRQSAELVRGLEETWSIVLSSLQHWKVADLDTTFRRPTPNAKGESPVRTRQWLIWHVAEHDVHHGGEISLTLGMHGLQGLDL
jgi:uncharacterized damage-inducible protein DinB